jgi:hypothetical protein
MNASRPSSYGFYPRQPLVTKPPVKKSTVGGYVKLFAVIILAAGLIWCGLFISSLGAVSADSLQPQIRVDVGDNCLDDYHGQLKSGSIVDSWTCNGTQSQAWSFSGNLISLKNKYCLAVTTDNKTVIERCSVTAHNQSWSRDGVGLVNNGNHRCLSLPAGKTKVQLITASCSQLTSVNESWTPDYWSGKPLAQMSSPACDQATIGARVACDAEKQWLAWQTEPTLHSVLLNYYTAGNPYEEWCADFVSYIYNEAGAPFKYGERGNGWDEYNANNIRYMGFTYHPANGTYLPQPGDVAFFDYAGGHVEIVAKGGPHPTFIYGDSGTIDPYTGNGNMAENQIVNDGSAGHLMYYLSPNPGV